MIFEEKEVILKNGKAAILKTAEIADAEKMLNFIKQASGETDFLSRYPEERTSTIEQEEDWIRNFRESESVLNITCFVDGEIAGNCDVRFPGGIKTSHRAVIGIAVLKDYWNLGIGFLMLPELINAAKNHGSELLELECFGDNKRAQHLYEKFGFCAVAVKPKAYKLKDGTYQDEIYMQKELT
ncbi:MAG: GNAT family N-acetyltransferase [Clostridia bacterium]|nr:GNAT family N-acetyltransferase [Clostridia bacterium]